MSMYIYGRHPVETLLRHHRSLVRKVYVLPQTQQLADRSLPVQTTDARTLESISKCKEHQGIVAHIEQFPYADLSDALTSPGPVCILDHIEDPGNLGAIVRNAYAFGVTAIIIPKHRACEITPSAIKASAGTAFLVPVIKITNLRQAIDELKSSGFWVYGLEASGTDSVSTVQFDRKTAFILGSEGHGVGKLLRTTCDFLVRIPMAHDDLSLNVSATASIVFQKIFSQR